MKLGNYAPELFKIETMARKTVYRSAETGEFVTKQFAEQNPETTVKETVCNLRDELIKFCTATVDEGTPEMIEVIVDEYLEDN